MASSSSTSSAAGVAGLAVGPPIITATITTTAPPDTTVFGTNPGSTALRTICPTEVYYTSTNTVSSQVVVFTPVYCEVQPQFPATTTTKSGGKSATTTTSQPAPDASQNSSTSVQPTSISQLALPSVTDSYSSASSSTATVAATTSTSNNHGGGGISAGATAGAAIGAAIGGAALAFLAALFLFRKRRNRYGGDGPRGAALMTSEKSSPNHPWEAFLPQSADDGTVRRSVEMLYSQIDQHVENYYRGTAMGTGMSGESQAALRAVDSGLLPGTVEEIMERTQTPLPVIKHCFAFVILSRLAPSSRPEQSLLPAEMARMPPDQRGVKGRSDREDRGKRHCVQRNAMS